MTSLEQVIEEEYKKNPNQSEKDLVNSLKQMKNPDTNKPWKASTIRNRVSSFYKKIRKEKIKEKKDVSDESAVEARGTGQVIKPHPGDPFKPKEETKTKTIESTDKEVLNDIQKKISIESAENKAFRGEVLNLVAGIADATKEEISKIRLELKSQISEELKSHVSDLPRIEPVKYEEIELKENIVEHIKQKTEDLEYEEDSDYVQHLIDFKTDSEKKISTLENLVSKIKNAGGSLTLKLFYDNDSLSCEEVKSSTGKRGISLKSLILGAILGSVITIIGVAIYLTFIAAPVVP